MNQIGQEVEKMLRENGVADVGFSRPEDAPEGLGTALSIVVPLLGAVVDEIDGGPTHTYFHHYRTVNAFIDQMLLRAGLMLQKEGYRAVPIPASQTLHEGGKREHIGRYSHKKAAVKAGLGTVGKSSLFLHCVHGPRVRLGTLFTDCPIEPATRHAPYICGDCHLCVKACPAGAILGGDWHPGIAREEIFDPHRCNTYMREHFMKIGRGAVCGICMRVCPAGARGSCAQNGGKQGR
jgi:epoxyqueuosine reductase QueG